VSAVKAVKAVKAAASVAAVVVAGCIAHSSYMMQAELTSAAIEPTASTAVVTFIRPSRYSTTNEPTILDESGRFVGECDASSKFSVAVAPGHHVFVVWAENSDALVADVAPGKHYFVEVSPTEGWTSARFHLIALTPRSPKWDRRPEWLARTQTLVPTGGGDAWIESRKADALERVRRGMDHLRGYDAVDLAKRTIRPDDGI